jgi:hypothetical protein
MPMLGTHMVYSAYPSGYAPYTERCASLKKTMNWNQLKNKIYAWDGGWLDIYVRDTTTKDWEKWTQYVNQNFRIDWYNGQTERDESKIDFTVIQEYWDGNHDLCSTAKVFIDDNIQVNSHFFDNEEIENDIDPREFKTIEDHNKLIDYLKGLSKILDSEVTVTPENCPDIELMKIKGESVEINVDGDPKKWPLRIKK